RHWRRHLSSADCPGAPTRPVGNVSLHRHDHPPVSSRHIRSYRIVLRYDSFARARTSASVGALLFLVATWRLSDGYRWASGMDGLQGRVVWRPNVLESCGRGNVPYLVPGVGIYIAMDPVHSRGRRWACVSVRASSGAVTYSQRS